MAFSHFHQSRLSSRRAVRLLFCLFLFVGLLFLMRFIRVEDHAERFLALLCLLSALALFLPKALFERFSVLQKRGTERAVGIMENLLGSAMALSWIGSVGPYRWGFGYDSFVHFSASLFAAVGVFVLGFTISDQWMTRPSASVALAVIGITMLFGLANELFEWGGDQLLGTHLYGEVGQPDDTWRDLAYDFFGACFGVFLSRRYASQLMAKG